MTLGTRGHGRQRKWRAEPEYLHVLPANLVFMSTKLDVIWKDKPGLIWSVLFSFC